MSLLLVEPDVKIKLMQWEKKKFLQTNITTLTLPGELKCQTHRPEQHLSMSSRIGSQTQWSIAAASTFYL